MIKEIKKGVVVDASKFILMFGNVKIKRTTYEIRYIGFLENEWNRGGQYAGWLIPLTVVDKKDGYKVKEIAGYQLVHYMNGVTKIKTTKDDILGGEELDDINFAYVSEDGNFLRFNGNGIKIQNGSPITEVD